MTTPTTHPTHRKPHTIAPTDTYHPTDPIWIYRTGTWRPGIIEQTSPHAATVTYRTGTGPATGVDTATAPYLQPRTEPDPHLDPHP